jgi:hypothetical protein
VTFICHAALAGHQDGITHAETRSPRHARRERGKKEYSVCDTHTDCGTSW